MEKSKPKYNRAGLEDLAKRRFFYAPGFQIYGGVAGLYDYGPTGCALKSNLEQLWRHHFVLEENMLEISGTCLTPEVVLKTSGHVDRFTDLMVRDVKTGDCYRADKLLEEVIDKMMENTKNPLSAERKDELRQIRAKADAYSSEELARVLKDLNIKSPDTGNDLTDPFPFNLMFGTQIGPTGRFQGFLRPETAQGIFVNFRRLLDFNNGRMPFAAAQIGLGFRNEIAPRSGLLRVREFTMAEIEHFVNPNDKSHPKFRHVADLKLRLFPREQQETTGICIEDMTLAEAVATGTIANETLAYFLARTHLFLIRAGIRPEGLRFRQHLSNEMAHYAADCWDAEIETSYGWVECAGHADRACFDLTQHSKVSKVDLVAHERLPEPRTVQFVESKIDKSKVGKTFKQAQKDVVEYLETIDDAQKLELQAQLAANGQAVIKVCTGAEYTLTSEMVKFEQKEKVVQEVTYLPSVIEPSFGIGRIIYAILEHAYQIREGDEQRAYLSLPPVLAPVKCSVLPLVSGEKLAPFVERVSQLLTREGLYNKVDESGQTIGRRYARTDEIGVPFGVTVDFETPESNTVTLRERDTMKQIRIPIDELAGTVKKIVDGYLTWDEVLEKYPLFVSKQDDE